jgi:hypothetical protein
LQPGEIVAIDDALAVFLGLGDRLHGGGPQAKFVDL